MSGYHIKSRGEFWTRCTRYSFEGAQRKVSIGALIALAFGAPLSWYNPQWVAYLNIALWAIPVATFLGVFFFQLYREPHRLYEAEAKRVKELEQEKNIRDGIASLIIEGVTVLNQFPQGISLPDGPDADYKPIQYFKAWRSRCFDAFTVYNRSDWEALFIADTSLNRRKSADDFRMAIKAGLKRLEEFLKDLRG